MSIISVFFETFSQKSGFGKDEVLKDKGAKLMDVQKKPHCTTAAQYTKYSSSPAKIVADTLESNNVLCFNILIFQLATVLLLHREL